VFRHTIPIGRVFGIPIDVDYSWFLIFALLTWILAVGYFPTQFKNWSPAEYWVVGAITAVMLFVSVVLHELGHSLVARRYKVPVQRITLFIFGGVSQITAEPPSAGAEFWVAIAGPAVSFALAIVFWGLSPLLAGVPPLLAVVKYLALLNLVLGVFNLIPGFPLDGGRVFRAIVWGIQRNFQRATVVAAVTGRFFGFLFILLGAWEVLVNRQVINGLWIAFIGWFLESAAASQVQQQLVKNVLEGHKVSEAMDRDYVRISGEMSLQELVDQHVLMGGHRCFVIGRGDTSAGLVTLADIRKVPRSAWPTTTASKIMIPREKFASVAPDSELWTALEKIGRNGVSQLPVVEDDRVVGILSREAVVRYLGTLQALTT
jgi:Zn-dependent protease